MFYSHTFLAKKSPLGTVWIAAHLEKRIKKHQLDEIDIPSYANCIMYPQFPIALRLSGHLLYGLVKIYSLKVKYLFQDCTRFRHDVSVYTNVQVDLPIDADRAPYDSITLPNTFNLDAMDIDDYNLGGPDRNLRELDEITIQDQILFEREQYISIAINEDINSSIPRITYPNHGPPPIEEYTLPLNGGQPCDSTLHVNADIIINSYGREYNVEEDVLYPPYEGEPGELDRCNFLNEPAEVMRDAVHNAETNPVHNNNIVENIEQSIHSTAKMSLSPIKEGLSVSGEGSFPSPARASLGIVPFELNDLAAGNTGISLGPRSPDIQIQPSPLVNQRVRNQRKRKQCFDEAIVMSNVEMKKQLEDPSKLVCKRKKLPCSLLDVWKFNKLHKNDNIFHEPLVTGMDGKLKELPRKKFPRRSSSTSHEASNEQVSAEDQDPVVPPNVVLPETITQDKDHVVPEMDEAPEIDRHTTDVAVNDAMQSSPVSAQEFTPANNDNYGSLSENPALGTIGLSERNTPSTNYNDSNRVDFSTLLNSAALEETIFTKGSNFTSRYDISNIHTMPATTKDFAIYLNEQSPATQTPDHPRLINLNELLESKPRKQCAKMFFETLVLKCYNVIDVQQKEAYGDILISMNPFSSAKLST